MSDRKKCKTRNYWLGIISRMHIYDTFYESLIKTLLFLVAFLVSVLPLFITDLETIPNSANLSEVSTNISTIDETDSYIAAGGALIVYGISLIAEVCMLLNPCDYLSKKLLTGSVLLIGAVMTAFGFVQIFTPKLSVSPLLITVIGSISVLIYIVDTITFYLAKPLNKYSSKGQESEIKNIYVGV